MIGICIPCFEPRLDDLAECIALMNDPEFYFIIVTNEPRPVTYDMLAEKLPEDARWNFVNTGSEEINLSKWWNIGLRYAKMLNCDTFMVTESDVRMTPASVKELRETLLGFKLGMIGPNLYGNKSLAEVLDVTRSQAGWDGRHPGWRICQTWMVPTAHALDADERFVWWVADEQHEMRHRGVLNGTGIVGWITYERELHQDTDPNADEQRRVGTVTARELFREEWGFPSLV